MSDAGATDETGPTGHHQALGFIHRTLKPRRYVEVGVGGGRSMSKVLPHTQAVGIDPFHRVTEELPKRQQLFTVPADTFFEVWDLEEVLGGKVDLAFIDGMHLFEYALRDFINVERHSTPETVVLIHDCYPMSREAAERARTTKLWTGDVWKLILCLRNHRPDLDVKVADIPKSGLGIVQGLDPSSTVLSDRLQEILREYVPMGPEALEPDKAAALERMDGDWETLTRVLPSQPYDNSLTATAQRFGKAARLKLSG